MSYLKYWLSFNELKKIGKKGLYDKNKPSSLMGMHFLIFLSCVYLLFVICFMVGVVSLCYVWAPYFLKLLAAKSIIALTAYVFWGGAAYLFATLFVYRVAGWAAIYCAFNSWVLLLEMRRLFKGDSVRNA